MNHHEGKIGAYIVMVIIIGLFVLVVKACQGTLR